MCVLLGLSSVLVGDGNCLGRNNLLLDSLCLYCCISAELRTLLTVRRSYVSEAGLLKIGMSV